MKARHSRSGLPILLILLLAPPGGVSASTSASDSVQFCVPFDYEQWRLENPRPSAKRTANLNVGESRTVRMIYFLPNDWPYRVEVVDSMKSVIRAVRSFYREQMKAHGYGEWTFDYETDAQGEPLVRRVDGHHPFSRYDNTLGTAVVSELEQSFDLDANIYFIVLGTDALRQGSGEPAGGVGWWRTKNGGALVVPEGFSFFLVAHELGHTFGLRHDFRDDAYIMSYGGRRRSGLSACAAENLAVHPYFNPDTPIEDAPPPVIEIISPTEYTPGSKSVSVRFRVMDPEGVHQVILFARASANYEVKACRGVNGKTDAFVEFGFDGRIPSDASTALSDAPTHSIVVEAVDTDGNAGEESFNLFERSPYRIANVTGHSDWVNSVSFSPDSTWLATGASGGVKLWDASSLAHVATLEGIGWFYSALFSPDGSMLASDSGSGVMLWDASSLAHIATLDDSRGVFSLSFSPDGRTLAAGSHKGTIELWNPATQEHIASVEAHAGFVGSVSFSPDGKVLASGSHDNTVKLWEVSTMKNAATFDVETFGVWSVAFSPDGRTLASGSARLVELWDVASGNRVATLEEFGGVNSVSFSRDGSFLASAAYDGTIKLWDVLTGENLAVLPNTDVVLSVAFSPDGRTLASGTMDGGITIWDVSSFIARSTRAADFDGDGKVGFPDFLLFAGVFGLGRGDAGFDARYDLDGNGAVGFSDLLIFAESFGR